MRFGTGREVHPHSGMDWGTLPEVRDGSRDPLGGLKHVARTSNMLGTGRGSSRRFGMGDRLSQRCMTCLGTLPEVWDGSGGRLGG